ncbi:MAG: 23S rRNA (guanosine(2251)-2'-O)-methyltransferase RlmB [Pseudomonadales bacterium]|nr:23S rRNA (guanosine(2251)-2'-O)-methyltransferase RlmB [Pseudomonadales bacterium]
MNKQITYGLHAVKEVLKQRASEVEQLLIMSGRKDKRIQEIQALAEKYNVSVTSATKADLDKQVSGKHQGVIAHVSDNGAADDSTMTEQQLLELVKSLASPFLLILDGVTDPHNLGACLRTADAAGIDAVIVPKDKSAGLNATVRKVASGAAESVPLVTVTNLARCLEKLKENGVWIIGTDDEAANSLFSQDFKGPIAVVMGSEGAGIRRLTREKCDYLVSIPMAGALSSLNVSVAAGIALFEAMRQRSES